MKRVVLLLALASFVLASCEKDPNNGKLDPNAMVSLWPAAGVKADDANPAHLTAKEIVEQTDALVYWNRAISITNYISRGFADAQRDLVKVRLLMWGTDIIDQDGKYTPEFIESEDVILVTTTDVGGYAKDTIAYVPNKVLHNAQKLIKTAYDKGDYTTCYDVFNEAFTFLPITGAEWRALKVKGEN